MMAGKLALTPAMTATMILLSGAQAHAVDATVNHFIAYMVSYGTAAVAAPLCKQRSDDWGYRLRLKAKQAFIDSNLPDNAKVGLLNGLQIAGEKAKEYYVNEGQAFCDKAASALRGADAFLAGTEKP